MRLFRRADEAQMVGKTPTRLKRLHLDVAVVRSGVVGLIVSFMPAGCTPLRESEMRPVCKLVAFSSCNSRGIGHSRPVCSIACHFQDMVNPQLNSVQ